MGSKHLYLGNGEGPKKSLKISEI
uniref:Uncharacterized protein n=1 Tax=Rhizophora mucronata TaxID=61149 RepID=A0A2P2QX74_RHIMU